MHKFLHACQVPPEVIGLCLQSGSLPWIIQDICWFCLNLLETLHMAQWEMSLATWKEGCADQMIKHHTLELVQV